MSEPNIEHLIRIKQLEEELKTRERLAEAANKEIDRVWKFSRNIGSVALLLLGLLGVFGIKSFRDIPENVHNAADIAIKRQLENRTDIQDMIAKAAQSEIGRIAVPLVTNQITTNIMPRIEAASTEISRISNSTFQINSRIESAEKKLATVSTTADFSLTLLRAENNDDAVSFRQLKQWASQTGFPLRSVADQSYRSIVDLDDRTTFVRKPSNIPFEVISSIKANVANFDGNFNLSMTPNEKIDRIDWYVRSIPSRDFKARLRALARLIEIYKTDESLRVVSFIGRAFSKEFSSPQKVDAEHPVPVKADELGKVKPLDMDEILREWKNYSQ